MNEFASPLTPLAYAYGRAFANAVRSANRTSPMFASARAIYVADASRRHARAVAQRRARARDDDFLSDVDVRRVRRDLQRRVAAAVDRQQSEGVVAVDRDAGEDLAAAQRRAVVVVVVGHLI